MKDTLNSTQGIGAGTISNIGNYSGGNIGNNGSSGGYSGRSEYGHIPLSGMYMYDMPYIDIRDASRLLKGVSVPTSKSLTQLHTQLHYENNERNGRRNLMNDNQRGSSNSPTSDNVLLANALKKQMEAETLAQETKQAHHAEQKKTMLLESNLENLKAHNNNTRDSKRDHDMICRDKLLFEVAKRTDAKTIITENKKNKMRATIVIALFLKKTAISFLRGKKKDRNLAQLSHALLGATDRKCYLKTIDSRKKATVLLQRRVRGSACRNDLKKRNLAAVQIQVCMVSVDDLYG